MFLVYGRGQKTFLARIEFISGGRKIVQNLGKDTFSLTWTAFLLVFY